MSSSAAVGEKQLLLRALAENKLQRAQGAAHFVGLRRQLAALIVKGRQLGIGASEISRAAGIPRDAVYKIEADPERPTRVRLLEGESP